MEIRNQVAVVPFFMVDLGWPYVGKCKGTDLISRGGARTNADSLADMPMPKDRLPLLYVCNRALDAAEVRFHAREVSRWLGLPWRQREVMERLDRVLECRIHLSAPHGWRRFRIVESREMDWTTGEIQLVFSREFRSAVRAGARYSLPVARQLTGKIATLDLYLMMMLLIRRGEYQPEWYVYNHLRRASKRYKVMSDMRKRLAEIVQAWPACPFEWVPNTLAIQCSRTAFDELVYHRHRGDVTTRLDATIGNKSYDELREYMDSLSPTMARHAKARYAARSFERDRRREPRASDFKMRLRVPKRRDPSDGTRKPADRGKPKTSPRPADPRPETAHRTRQTAAPENPVMEREKPRPQQPMTPPASEAGAPRTARPRTRKVDRKEGAPTQGQASTAPGIIDRARNRLAGAKRLTARLRNLGRSK